MEDSSTKTLKDIMLMVETINSKTDILALTFYFEKTNYFCKLA